MLSNPSSKVIEAVGGVGEGSHHRALGSWMVGYCPSTLLVVGLQKKACSSDLKDLGDLKNHTERERAGELAE